MSKSIVIDATHFGLPEPTGVERYVDMILPLITERLVAAEANVIWVGHNAPVHVPKGVIWLTSEHSTGWGQFVVRELMGSSTHDLFFTPSGIAPLGRDFKRAMVIHDLSFIKYPAAYSASQKIRMSIWMPRAAKACNIIITPSEFVKQDIMKEWNIPGEKIVVTQLGPVPLSKEVKPVKDVDKTKPYLLFVGRVEEKKNLPPVLLAFGELAKTMPDLHFVIAGKPGVGSEKVDRTIKELPAKVASRVIRAGYVSDEEQSWLYQHACVVVVPSPAEGFGFPVLEGFEAGVPVVTAHEGAAPEIGGNAVLVAQADSATAWGKSLKQAIEDEPQRKKMIEAGTKRLKDFDWEKTADLTAGVLIKY